MTRIDPKTRDWWVVCPDCPTAPDTDWGLNDVVSDADYEYASDAKRAAQDLQNEHALTIGHSDVYRIRLHGGGQA